MVAAVLLLLVQISAPAPAAPCAGCVAGHGVSPPRPPKPAS